MSRVLLTRANLSLARDLVRENEVNCYLVHQSQENIQDPEEAEFLFFFGLSLGM